MENETEKRIRAVKTDWETKKMPFLRSRFTVRKALTPAQKERLRCGHIPREMEDKWFWYMEGNKLYAHRSWTGICVFILTIREGSDRIAVTVNRSPKEYRWSGLREEKETVCSLLDWWCGEEYDYYGEWLSETVDAIEKSR